MPQATPNHKSSQTISVHKMGYLDVQFSDDSNLAEVDAIRIADYISNLTPAEGKICVVYDISNVGTINPGFCSILANNDSTPLIAGCIFITPKGEIEKWKRILIFEKSSVEQINIVDSREKADAWFKQNESKFNKIKPPESMKTSTGTGQILTESILDVLNNFQKHDFSHRVKISDVDDPLSKIAKAINEIGEEFSDFKSKRVYVAEAKTSETQKTINLLRETQAQLVQASKLSSLGTMATGIAHELNNPLAIIRAYAEILGESDDLTAQQTKMTTKIVTATRRMGQVISHLRTFARESRSKNSKFFAPNQALIDSFIFVGQQLQTENIRYILNLDPMLPKMMGNQTQIETVIQNLLLNSKDAFESVKDNREKNITINSKAVGDSILITYSDNASGMDEHQSAKVFEPFFTTKEAGSGTGLGMSVSHGIIKQHQGSISVKSEKNSGTTFEISLPQSPENLETRGATDSIESQVNIASSNNEVSEREKSETKILVVDDEIEITSIIKIQLSRQWEVDTATDATIALESFSKGKYKLIITDLAMPKMSGIQFVQNIRKIDKEVKIIAITGYGETSRAALDVLKAGAEMVITKPFSAGNKISGIVGQILRRENQPASESAGFVPPPK